MTDASAEAPRLERFTYDDDIVRKFFFATVFWGVVGMLVGLTVAFQMVAPVLNADLPWLTFGRLRPLHTNGVIFGFAANAIFTAMYYSVPRLLKTPMWSEKLSRFHFWGWQGILVAAAITLPLGITQGKEYAELEWPIDLAIAVVWLAMAYNVFMTIRHRRQRHMYVAIWFFIASIVTVTILHVFNNLVVPVGLTKSYSIYAGVQDAFMQWWYGHNAVAFVLTTPFLGMMYYFLPKAAGRPVYSYRLSIAHFWSLVFIYIWAGPHHLHYTALPEWASTLGMLFSVMLWIPSWGGMINGLLTLRGGWDRVARDPVLKFFVAGVTFYGMSTFEGPMLSVKAVNSLSHYTDWTVGHVHAGTLGWNGFMTFGMLYWLAPRLFQTKKLYSEKLANLHFWVGTVGILFYIVALYAAGITQGLMWRAFDETGQLMYGDFIETVVEILPMWWLRAIGGTLYLIGVLIGAYNLRKTWAMRPSSYAPSEDEAPALSEAARLEPAPAREGGALAWVASFRFHRFWERRPVRFTVYVTVAVAVASLFEIVPTFLVRSNVPSIASVEPYTPLELYGRDIYIREGCYNCHSQMVRPIWAETVRYGEYSKAGEFVYDHPFQWGSRRIGPDLHRVGGKYSHGWHVEHMMEPAKMVKKSIMPRYPWLFEDEIDYESIQGRVNAMAMLGVPYGEAVTGEAPRMAREQAARIAAQIEEEGGPDLADKEIVALIAYLQRLGTDIKKMPEGDEATASGGTGSGDGKQAARQPSRNETGG